MLKIFVVSEVSSVRDMWLGLKYCEGLFAFAQTGSRHHDLKQPYALGVGHSLGLHQVLG